MVADRQPRAAATRRADRDDVRAVAQPGQLPDDAPPRPGGERGRDVAPVDVDAQRRGRRARRRDDLHERIAAGDDVRAVGQDLDLRVARRRDGGGHHDPQHDQREESDRPGDVPHRANGTPDCRPSRRSPL
jgi:hypothetical protein